MHTFQVKMGGFKLFAFASRQIDNPIVVHLEKHLLFIGMHSIQNFGYFQCAFKLLTSQVLHVL